MGIRTRIGSCALLAWAALAVALLPVGVARAQGGGPAIVGTIPPPPQTHPIIQGWRYGAQYENRLAEVWVPVLGSAVSVRLFDISDPLNPLPLVDIPTASAGLIMTMNESVIWLLGTPSAGLWRVDFTDLNNIQQTHFSIGAGGTPSSVRMEAHGDLLFVITSSNIRIYDTSDPTQLPLLVDLNPHIVPTALYKGIMVAGNRVYSATTSGSPTDSTQFSIWDISDPTTPVLISTTEFPLMPFYFRLNEKPPAQPMGTLIFADGRPTSTQTVNFPIIDVSNESFPVVIGGIATGLTSSNGWLRHVGTTAYVAIGGDIYVYDLSVPSAPVQRFHGSAVDGTYFNGFDSQVGAVFVARSTSFTLTIIDGSGAIGSLSAYVLEPTVIGPDDDTIHGIPLSDAHVFVLTGSGDEISPGFVAPSFSNGSLSIEGDHTIASLFISGGSVTVDGVLTTASFEATDTAVTVDGVLAADTFEVSGTDVLIQGELEAGSVAAKLGTQIDLRGRITTGNILLEGGSRLTHPQFSLIDLSVAQDGSDEVRGADILVSGDAFIDATSRIDVSEKGYFPGDGPGAGVNMLRGPSLGGDVYVGSGAGHGGIGGAANGRQPDFAGGAYGDFRWPTEFGSGGGAAGGGAGCSGGPATAKGGGVITLHVSGELRIDGWIEADGQASGGMTGGGSGGSVLVTTSSLRGSGSITAIGGASQGSGFCGAGGAGAGGRIAVYAGESLGWSGAMSAHAGIQGSRAGAGTIYFGPGMNAEPQLIIDNSFVQNGILSENGVTPLGGDHAVGLVRIREGGLLSGVPDGEDMRLFAASDVIVESGAYLGVGGFIFDTAGATPGETGEASGGGAGHGGAGGRGGDNSFDGVGGEGGGITGTAQLSPPSRGSRGGRASNGVLGPSGPGGAGGGFLEVNAASQLIINGALNADGTDGPAGTGGGSGGGILMRAGSITGTGSITARGGDGGSGQSGFGGTAGGGGGGGGRIAWASCDASIGSELFLSAAAGAGGTGNEAGGGGSPGSIFQRTDYATVRHEPSDAIVPVFTVAEFVYVTPTGPFSTFQWYRDGVVLTNGVTPTGSIVSGAQSPVLTVLWPGPQDEARYSCAASGPCGNSTSRAAWLIVGDVSPEFCPVDVDGNGRIDIDDLYYITQHPTDINGDGIADAEDARCLERYLRRNELEDMSAGRR